MTVIRYMFFFGSEENILKLECDGNDSTNLSIKPWNIHFKKVNFMAVNYTSIKHSLKNSSERKTSR